MLCNSILSSELDQWLGTFSAKVPTLWLQYMRFMDECECIRVVDGQGIGYSYIYLSKQ